VHRPNVDRGESESWRPQTLKTDKPVWETIIKAADRYAASIRRTERALVPRTHCLTLTLGPRSVLHTSAMAFADAIDKLGEYALSQGKGGAADLGACLRTHTHKHSLCWRV
jgi:hypothetical protein